MRWTTPENASVCRTDARTVWSTASNRGTRLARYDLSFSFAIVGPSTTRSSEAIAKASGRSQLTRQPKQIDAQLGKQTGAELSALFVRRCLVPPSGLCRPVWVSRMTKPAEDRVAGELNPAGRLSRSDPREGVKKNLTEISRLLAHH